VITVLEAAACWGGVVQSSVDHGCVLEHGPDSLIRSKPAGMALIHDLGLDSEVQDTETVARSALVARGDRLIPIPPGLYLLAPGRWWPFAWSPLVSWPGKLRMALDLVLPRRPADAPEESLGAFVRRRLGREALERIAQPLVSGIYTADPERLSLSATMPQFPEMERTHRSLLLAMRARARGDAAHANASGPRYGLFASLRGGLGRLIDRLIERLAGCDLRLGVAATALRRDGDVWRISLDAGGSVDADAVALALPAPAAAELIATSDRALADDLRAIPYAGVATINLAFARSQVGSLPTAAGFVVPAVEHRATIACTFASAKYAGRAPPELVLLRAFIGGALHPQALDRDDPALVAAVLADLRALLPITGDPVFSRVHRWPGAMAQYVIGHRERVARIRAAEAALPGLALVGNGYEGVGIPDLAAQAEAAAGRLAAGGIHRAGSAGTDPGG